MNEDKDDRARRLAVYMIESGGTVRSAAKEFGISKSTVHKDLCEVLPRTSPALYAQVRELMDRNKSLRHIRGGMATRRKYAGSQPGNGKIPAEQREFLWSASDQRSSASCTGFS